EEGFEHDLRIHHVEGEARETRPVADALQPVVLRAQSPVAGQKAGDEEDRLAQTGWNVIAPEHRVANETQELEGEAAFQPHRRQRVPPAELPEVGNDRRAGGQPAGALAMGWFGGRCHFVLLSVYSVLKLRRRWGFYTRPM